MVSSSDQIAVFVDDVLPTATVAATMLLNPRLGGLAKHHPADAGDGQNHGQHVGLAETLGQQAQRAGGTVSPTATRLQIGAVSPTPAWL